MAAVVLSSSPAAVERRMEVAGNNVPPAMAAAAARNEAGDVLPPPAMAAAAAAGNAAGNAEAVALVGATDVFTSASAFRNTTVHKNHTIMLPGGLALVIVTVSRQALVVAVNRKTLPQGEDITGLRLWDFGTELARFVVRHRSAFAGRRVLELGAGCGTLSLAVACACKGADVVATDASSVEFLRTNVARNRARVVARSIRLERLLWTVDDEQREDNNGNGSASGVMARLGRHRYDWVLGTDLLYHLTSCAAAFATAKRLLAPAGVFVLGGHARYHGTIATVRAQAAAAGFVLRFVDLRVLHKREGFKYCSGDFMATMARSEDALDAMVGGDYFDPPLAFDDTVNDDFDSSSDDY